MNRIAVFCGSRNGASDAYRQGAIQLGVELADGFIALPGGPGTLEEFMEVFTWAQLGIHQKPCGLLNVNHYFDPLVSFFHHMADQQFLDEKYRDMALVDSSPSALLDQFGNFQPPGIKTY